MPSRSTRLQPSVRTVKSKLAMLSSRRLISSTYSTPRWAAASNPGWKTVSPRLTDCSTSTEPTSRSSVTPRGICTNGAGIIWVVGVWLGVCCCHSWGDSLAMLSLTISMGGSREWMALAMTDLAVPRRPAMATPPKPGSTDASNRESFMASCPTTALRGKAVWLMGLTGTGILFKIFGYSHAVSRSFLAYLTGGVE